MMSGHSANPIFSQNNKDWKSRTPANFQPPSSDKISFCLPPTPSSKWTPYVYHPLLNFHNSNLHLYCIFLLGVATQHWVVNFNFKNQRMKLMDFYNDFLLLYFSVNPYQSKLTIIIYLQLLLRYCNNSSHIY